MPRRGALLGIVAMVFAGVAAAAPETSLRPKPRLQAVAAAPAAGSPAVVVRYDASIRPRPRPVTRATVSRVSGRTAPTATHALATTVPVFRSPRPQPRRARAPVRTAAPVRVASTGPAAAIITAGAICGSNAIRGERLSAIPGKLPGCGVSNPVRVQAVDGVKLSRGAIMDCTTAKTLRAWVRNGVQPAFAKQGKRVVELEIADHYNCRTRNHKPGAKISEHGKGHAVDVSAFRLNDGARVTIKDDWRGSPYSRALKTAHSEACGRFGTVLGPDADKYHVDHFHLDTVRGRRTAYCR